MKEIFINLFFIHKKNTFQSQKLKMFVPSSCVSWSSTNILACSTFSFSRLSISFRQSDFSIFFTRIFLSFLINFNNLKKLNYILNFFSLNISTRIFFFFYLKSIFNAICPSQKLLGGQDSFVPSSECSPPPTCQSYKYLFSSIINLSLFV